VEFVSLLRVSLPFEVFVKAFLGRVLLDRVKSKERRSAGVWVPSPKGVALTVSVPRPEGW
jgi:hypothetical protein